MIPPMARKSFALIAGIILSFVLSMPNPAQSADLTTKYRVYQYTNLLLETADKDKAIAHAKKYGYSYVEEIGTRRWIFHQFPKYHVYQFGKKVDSLFTLQQAIQVAQTKDFAYIRHEERVGWIWHNWPRYQLYQGEFTKPEWRFSTLEEAKREAQKWANSFIISLDDNRYVWDNMSPEKKAEYRSRPKKYKIYQNDFTQASWEFAHLEDAIKEAVRWENSRVVNTETNKEVFSNRYRFAVYQYEKKLKDFVSLTAAMNYAQKWDHATIRMDSREIWSNYPEYVVYEHSKKVKEFRNIADAVYFARTLQKAVVKRYTGFTIWDNSTGLKYWAWTGSMSADNVKKVVSQTIGLDVISPTWFQLSDGQGHVLDRSDKQLADWLRQQKLEIHPLVNNQFDPDLTTKFLADPKAQTRFINTVVKRSLELGARGINLDFEGMRGSDRDRYTNFVKLFAEKAHAHGLQLSIDLPRGSHKWNHLSAYDHEKLAPVVDHIMIMTYDEHWAGSDKPGPVGSLDWVETGIREFLAYGIPRDKLIMGIPFYVRQWKVDKNGKILGTNAVYTHEIADILKKHPHTKTWDPEFRQYRIEYTRNGEKYVFYLDDEQTLKARLDLAKKYSLAGISAWRLGQEPASFWNMLAHNK